MSKLNVNPGGKNTPNMHDTIIPESNPFGKGGQVQKMQFDDVLPDDHPHKAHEGQPKGLRVLAEERGYTHTSNGKRLIGECKVCKLAKARKPHLTELSPEELQRIEGDDANDTEEEEERPIECCLKRLMSFQDDFKREKSMLEIVSPAFLVNTASNSISSSLKKLETSATSFPSSIPSSIQLSISGDGQNITSGRDVQVISVMRGSLWTRRRIAAHLSPFGNFFAVLGDT